MAMKTLRAIARRLPRPVRARIKRMLPQEIDHSQWISRRLEARKDFYPGENEPGLFCILTTVWNTPVQYLRILAESLFVQAQQQEFEWVLLDNGTTDAETREYLHDLVKRHPEIRFFRVEENLGILGGQRFCLERASGRYVVPVDSDDYLYPDSLSVLRWYIRQFDFPRALYSDEELRQDDIPTSPSFKPDWDPVLFVDYCYIAHLCAFDRSKALELGVYSSSDADGCHDWDTYLRFWHSGENPIHVPEILYSWRMHPASAAQNMESKSYIFDSHRAVLGRYIDSLEHPEHFTLLPGQMRSVHPHVPAWWIRRKHTDGAPLTVVRVTEFEKELAPVLPQDVYPNSKTVEIRFDRGLTGLRETIRQMDTKGLIAVVSDWLLIESYDWPWEALGLFERYPDTAIAGGLLYGYDGKVLDGGIHFGFGGAFGCPDRGNDFAHPGYWAQQWACHTVSCVNSMFCVFDGQFLADILEPGDWMRDSLIMLSPHAAVKARRANRRVVFCPTIRAKTHQNWLDGVSVVDRARFMEVNSDCFPDQRYYSPLLSDRATRAFKAGSPKTRIVVQKDVTIHEQAIRSEGAGRRAEGASMLEHR